MFNYKGFSAFLLVSFSLLIVACSKQKDAKLEKTESDFFVKYYGSPSVFGKAFGSDIKQTSDGGYVTIGTNFKTSASQIYLIKLNEYGNKVWEKEFGGDNNDIGKCVQIMSDGGYPIFGTSSVPLNDTIAYNSFYLARANSSGDKLWSKTYGGKFNANGFWAENTLDGGFIMVGDADTSNGINGNPNGAKDIFIVKADKDGNMEWRNFYGGKGNDYANDVLQKNDQGYMILGTTDSFKEINQDNSNCIIVETNSKGYLLDRFTYGGLDVDEGYDIEKNDDGYIFVGSKTTIGLTDVYVVKIDKNIHSIISERTIGNSNYNENGYSIERSSTGYIIGGNKFVPEQNNYDQYFVKLDFALDTLWTKNYGSIEEDKVIQISADTDGGYAGIGFSSYGGNQMFTVQKVNQHGEMRSKH